MPVFCESGGSENHDGCGKKQLDLSCRVRPACQEGGTELLRTGLRAAGVTMKPKPRVGSSCCVLLVQALPVN